MHKAFGKQSEMGSGKGSLRPLPAVRFDGARYKEAKVNRYSMVQFETNRYSVPTIYVGDPVVVVEFNAIKTYYPWKFREFLMNQRKMTWTV